MFCDDTVTGCSGSCPCIFMFLMMMDFSPCHIITAITAKSLTWLIKSTPRSSSVICSSWGGKPLKSCEGLENGFHFFFFFFFLSRDEIREFTLAVLCVFKLRLPHGRSRLEWSAPALASITVTTTRAVFTISIQPVAD